MILQTILEGLGVLLVLVYASGIRKSSVVMVHLYHEDVQVRCVELKLTTREKSCAMRFSLSSFAFRAISPMC